MTTQLSDRIAFVGVFAVIDDQLHLPNATDVQWKVSACDVHGRDLMQFYRGRCPVVAANALYERFQLARGAGSNCSLVYVDADQTAIAATPREFGDQLTVIAGGDFPADFHLSENRTEHPLRVLRAAFLDTAGVN